MPQSLGPFVLQLGAWPFTDPAWRPMLALASLLSPSFTCTSAVLIQEFYRRQKFFSGDRYQQAFKWLLDLLTGRLVLTVLSLAVVLTSYLFLGHSADAKAYTYSSILFLCTLIGVTGKALLRSPILLPQNFFAVSKPLLPADLRAKAAWVKQEVKTKQYYEDPELTLGTLAGKLEMTVHELSHLINTVFRKSFNDFIGEYRVASVIRKMQDPAYDHITLLGIAYDSALTRNPLSTAFSSRSPAKARCNIRPC